MKLNANITATALAAVMSVAAIPAQAKSAAEWMQVTAAVTVGLNQAIEKAQMLAPGQVIDAELEAGKKGAAPYYAVKVISAAHEEIKLRVNATTGDAAIEKNKGKASSKDIKHLADAKITLAQAVDKAVTAMPGKPLEAQLDSDWGKTSYKVKLLQADKVVMKVRLDPVTGAVTGSEKD